MARSNTSRAFARLLPASVDFGPVARPLLDFLEVTGVGKVRAVGFLVEGDVVGFRFLWHGARWDKGRGKRLGPDARRVFGLFF